MKKHLQGAFFMLMKITTNKSPITAFWLVVWSLTLTLGWLLPNHYRPWIAFHSDAVVTIMILLMSGVVIVYKWRPVALHPITISVFLMFLIPWVQYLSGLVPVSGNAWISSAYLFGLLMAIITGSHWEETYPGQLANGLFLAIGIAAILSVGIQIWQWLQLDGLTLWIMGTDISRPHANFAQPNQLATFLLWGVLAIAWGILQKKISYGPACLAAVFLLFGVALTGSRAAWIGVSVLIAASWLWRRFWSLRVSWTVTGLGVYFFVCVVFVGWLRHVSQDSVDIDGIARINGELRPLAWKIFLDAISERPFWGYGWNQTGFAQLNVAINHPATHIVFSYSHNLFVDLLLWCGIPLGGLISAYLIWWFWGQLRTVNSAENAVLVLFLLVIANHAMFELPLYYAYLLFPVGLVIGILNARANSRAIFSLGIYVFAGMWLASATLLVLLVRDYVRVEPSYQTLRLEWDRIKITMPVGPPAVLLLTQWHDFILYARFEPKKGLSAAELQWMRDVTNLFPSAIFAHKLATALALNQRPEEAQLWLARTCKIVSEKDCGTVQIFWEKQSLTVPEIAAVPWPIKSKQ